MLLEIFCRSLLWLFWNLGYTLSSAPIMMYLSVLSLKDIVMRGAAPPSEWLMVIVALTVSCVLSVLLIVWMKGLVLGWPERECSREFRARRRNEAG